MSSDINFKNPPINELVCGIQFNPISIPFIYISNEFFSTIEAEFPNVVETAPLPQRFDVLTHSEEGEIELENPYIRYLFKDSKDIKLIQLQNGKYSFNWRKPDGNDEAYPRFSKLFKEFLQYWNILNNIFKKNNVEIEFNQLELTYIDLIIYDNIGTEVNHFHKIFSFLKENSNLLNSINGLKVELFKPINDLKGHYYLSFHPAQLKKDLKEVIVLDSTIRGMFTEKNENIEEWFVNAHKEILNNFIELINDPIKEKWGLER